MKQHDASESGPIRHGVKQTVERLRAMPKPSAWQAHEPIELHERDWEDAPTASLVCPQPAERRG